MKVKSVEIILVSSQLRKQLRAKQGRGMNWKAGSKQEKNSNVHNDVTVCALPQYPQDLKLFSKVALGVKQMCYSKHSPQQFTRFYYSLLTVLLSLFASPLFSISPPQLDSHTKD